MILVEPKKMSRPYKEMPQTKDGAKCNEWLLFAHANGGVKRTLKLLKELSLIHI